MTLEKTRKWRWGVNRWFILVFVVLGIITSGIYAPLLPHIQVAPERISSTPLFTLPVIGDFYMTNTLLATFIVDIILLLIALAVRKATSSGSMVPGGISGAVEALLETLYNLTESTAGKWAKTIFPYFATITMMVLFANWLELIPGVDSIGILEHSEHGYLIKDLWPGVAAVIKGEAAGGELGIVSPICPGTIHRLEFHRSPGCCLGYYDPGDWFTSTGSKIPVQILQCDHIVYQTRYGRDGSGNLHS